MAEWEWWTEAKRKARSAWREAKQVGKSVAKKTVDVTSDAVVGASMLVDEAKSRYTGENYDFHGNWNKFQENKRKIGTRGVLRAMGDAAIETPGALAADAFEAGKQAAEPFTEAADEVVEKAKKALETIQDKAQKTYIEAGHQVGDYIKGKFGPEMSWWLNYATEKTGLRREDIKEGVKILGEGALSLSSDVIFHPLDSAANLYNLGRNGMAHLIYSPKKENAIPEQVQDPVIVAVYRLGGRETPPGHAALWYRGQTVDAYVGEGNVFNGVSVDTVFRPNKGVAGKQMPEWGDEGPFVFGTKDCDFYVVDAAKIGFDTPEKKQQFLDNIVRERNASSWDLNSENCATRVNRVTNDFFLDVPRLHSEGLKNFDFPISIGGRLLRMCQTGDAFALTPEAIVGHGQMLAMQNKKKEAENTAIASNSTSPAPAQPEQKEVTDPKPAQKMAGEPGIPKEATKPAPGQQMAGEPGVPKGTSEWFSQHSAAATNNGNGISDKLGGYLEQLRSAVQTALDGNVGKMIDTKPPEKPTSPTKVQPAIAAIQSKRQDRS